jgi:hypothetical protein
MNLTWLATPAATVAMLSVCGVCFLYLLFTMMARMQALDRRRRAQQEATDRLVEDLRAQIHGLVEDARRPVMPPALLQAGLNVHQRAEALRMFRRGNDAEAICQALGLPPAEARLLEKVHRVMVDAGQGVAN